jgi:ketosteroid isomerase-like protein
MSLRIAKTRGTQGKHYWLLFVMAALLGGSLTVVIAQAQQKASDAATFRKLTDAYCAAWSTLDTSKVAVFYAQDAGLVFYDLAPFSYHGWQEYKAGAQKEFLDTIVSGKLTAGDDLKVTRRGNIAWTTVSLRLVMDGKDGKKTDLNARYTGIWEHRAGKWIIVHEHLSVPLGGS